MSVAGAFWGCVVKGQKAIPFVPPADEAWNLHLSQASLPASVPEGTRCSILLKTSADDEGVVICTLKAGSQDSVALDLFLDHYAEFQLLGPGASSSSCAVHLSGYWSPPDVAGGMPGSDDEDDEDYMGEDEDEHMEMVDHPLAILHGDGDEFDEDEDEEDDDDEDEDEDEDEEPLQRVPSHVIIEELPDDYEEPAAATAKQQQGKAEGAHKPGKEGKQEAGAKKAAAAADNKRAADAAAPAEQPASKKKKEQAPTTPAADKGKQTPGGKQQQQQQAKTPAQQTPAASKAEQAKAKTPAQQTPAAQNGSAAQEVKTGKKDVRTWENGFTIENVSMGAPNGKLAKPGKKVKVNYVGRLKSNGKVFDSSKGRPFQFRLGVGEVVKGWDLGVDGMRVGDKRRLIIPPQFAYGAQGVKGAIPPNATLEFDVELVDVK